jgi:anti-sigma regulatory factor (Ser/Thr protein kinase)
VTVTVSRPAELAKLRRVMRRVLAVNGVTPAVAEEIVLATQEASKNALTFGGTSGAGATVAVRLERSDVVVEVADAGVGFPCDPREVPAAGPLDEHGRGLFLMRRFMDTLEVVPCRVGTIVRMTRHVDDRELSGADEA